MRIIAAKVGIRTEMAKKNGEKVRRKELKERKKQGKGGVSAGSKMKKFLFWLREGDIDDSGHRRCR